MESRNAWPDTHYLAYLGMEPLLKELQSLFNVVQDISTQSRMLAWKDAWGMIRVFPFIGIGLGAFGSVFPMFSIMSGALGRLTWLYAHNDYLQVWAGLGIGCLILICIGLAFFFIRIVRWVRQRESSHRSREARRYLELGFYTAIFCFLMHSMVGYSFYIPANIFLFVVICGMLIRLPMRSHRYFEYNFSVKKGALKFVYAFLLGVILCLIIAAIRGGYGEGGYRSIGDREFREKTLKEIPVALSMPLWNNSPYRHYF